ncbi:hypothetical protein OIU35_29075 [Boseaceae bacterium BT-24-1]|nr:hypothetical protein [Boseaceae bacterium BT-24-1]
MLPLSVDEQDRFIRRDYPGFRLVHDNGGLFAIWRGRLAPIAQGHEIEIAYCPRLFFEEFTVTNERVAVRLVAPGLVYRHPDTGEIAPHIYLDVEDPARSCLCLYDYRDDEWGPHRAIAETIIPWASEWLFFYEAWLATGIWSGGGHDHSPIRGSTPCPTNAPSCPDPLAPTRSEEFHRLGRRIGTSASLLSMAAASEACFPQPSWLAWRRLSPAGVRFPTTST